MPSRREVAFCGLCHHRQRRGSIGAHLRNAHAGERFRSAEVLMLTDAEVRALPTCESCAQQVHP